MPTPPIATFNTVLDRIRAFAAASNWKPARLARKAGLSDVTTRGMSREDWAPSGSTVRALESLIPADWKPGDPVPVEERASDAESASAMASAEAGG